MPWDKEENLGDRIESVWRCVKRQRKAKDNVDFWMVCPADSGPCERAGE